MRSQVVNLGPERGGAAQNGLDCDRGRYIGALVADFHRTLLKGGIFMYPADSKSPAGKLRYLYEAAPLGFVCEQAGGAASNGRDSILKHVPATLHERTPLFLGSPEDVATAEQFLSGER